MATARAPRARKGPFAAGAVLLAGALLAALPADRAAAEDGDPGLLRFGESAAVPCTLRARAVGTGDETGPAFSPHERCEAAPAVLEPATVPLDAQATWGGAYRGIDVAAGVRVRTSADSLLESGAEDSSLSLGGSLRFRGLTVGATYVGDRLADTLGYGIGAAYRFGPFRVGAGLAETRPERQARPDETAAARTFALDIEYSFLPALRGFVEYLSVAPGPDERPDPAERDSMWAVGLTLGF